MPPKVKVTQDQIIQAAMDIVRETGIEGLNARALAHHLNCSIQPIFKNFETMGSLKQALLVQAQKIYDAYTQKGMDQPNPFLGIGLGYIQFAQEEKNLFKLLFMTHEFKQTSLIQIIKDDENQEVVKLVAQLSGLNLVLSEQLFINVWLITHGIASMCATNDIELSLDEVTKILRDAFTGFKHQLQKEKETHA
jgi:AcrR family transcriptional regulator